MRMSIKIAVVLMALALLVGAVPRPSSAQLVLADMEYYVTELRPGKLEFGVAAKKGQYTENWVHVKPDTKISIRKWLGQGKGFTDQVISGPALFNHLRLGQKVHVNGGRNFDGSVNAKKIWF